jgi:hypothetical protein
MLGSMALSMTLTELFAETVGAKLELQREEDLYAMGILALPNGRRMIVIERTYRDGIHVILDPTQDELAVARDGNLYQLFSSERGSFLASALRHETGLFGEDDPPTTS